MTNKELFKQAVNEGFMLQMEHNTAVFGNDPICSEEHYRKLSEIFGFEVKRPKMKSIGVRRTVAAILIAASLLLAGCTAIVYKEQIGEFFTTVYDTFIKGSFADEDSENKDIIEEYYTLTYVPEGYELVDELSTQVFSRFKWNNNNYEVIVFEQYLLDTTQFTLNAESGYTSVVEYADLILYCRTIENYKYYIWCDDNYSYSLKVCVEIDDNELYQIFDGVFPKTN